MTEEQAKYRSGDGTVVYAQFPARPLRVDGPGSEAEYRVGHLATPQFCSVAVQLCLPFPTANESGAAFKLSPHNFGLALLAPPDRTAPS